MPRNACVLVLALIAAAAPALSLAQEGGAGSVPKTLPPDKREPLKQLTALFLVTLLILLVLVVVIAVLVLLQRRSLKALEDRRGEGPTELEDLWWQMKPPEEDDKEE